MRHTIYAALSVLLLTSCASEQIAAPKTYTCAHEQTTVDVDKTDKALDSLSEFFENGCYPEVIDLGENLRRLHRDKFYKVTSEAAEVFTPDGSVTPYILEAYERVYLSILLSIAYDKTAQREKAQVELRHAYDETWAMIYNKRIDPVTIVLQAALWEHYEKLDWAEPLWRKAAEIAPENAALKAFVQARVERYDRGEKVTPLYIYGIGELPDVDWHTGFGSRYEITANAPFFESCSTKDELVLSNKSWMHELSMRYNDHPLRGLKAAARLPVGLTYGLATAGAGVAVSVGCLGLLVAAHGDDPRACEYAFAFTLTMLNVAGRVTDYMLAPDLRRWRRLPEGFYFAEPSAFEKPACVSAAESGSQGRFPQIY